MASQAQRAMLDKIKTRPGFIAALDQSGGSSPKALRLYGVNEDAYHGDEEMFTRVHEMRTRIVTSKAFNGERILGAILFENTLEREIQGMPSAHYLWRQKNVVPFLKVDQGLADESNGVHMMKPMKGLDALLQRANAQEVFGTKMRSVVKLADPAGIKAVVAQQFDIGRHILEAGLVPIIEPEVDINSPDKAEAEVMLRKAIMDELDQLSADRQLMLKLTLPSEANFYKPCIGHPAVLKVVALSGGYSRDEANAKLAQNHGMIASFSRALTEGISARQSDEEFDAALDQAIESIYQASCS